MKCKNCGHDLSKSRTFDDRPIWHHQAGDIDKSKHKTGEHRDYCDCTNPKPETIEVIQ